MTAVHRGYDYVIIANSDVLFGAGTIDRMMEVMTTDERIGSVTAWSNNVSIYSLPNDDPDTYLADQAFVDWVGDTTAGEFGPSAVDIPAGISFCILIPTAVLRTVGLMDPVFGRGYCEETDWTLRSQALGYRIALAPSAFVYHRGQGSNRDAGMLASGHTSVPAHERIIDLRYPLFREQVNGFINSEILDLLWNSARRAILTSAAAECGLPDCDLVCQNPKMRCDVRTVGHLRTGCTAPSSRSRDSADSAWSFPGRLRAAISWQSITDFFGRSPDSVRLADHSPLSSEVGRRTDPRRPRASAPSSGTRSMSEPARRTSSAMRDRCRRRTHD